MNLVLSILGTMNRSSSMDQEELLNAVEEAGVEVSDTDLFWMEKVHRHRRQGENPSIGELLVRYHEELPGDYVPAERIEPAPKYAWSSAGLGP